MALAVQPPQVSSLLAGENKINMNKIVCYCFNYTESDIRNDVLRNNGQSSILETIVAEKQQGACQCPTKHPEGR